MNKAEIMVIGAGPAGLSAALAASSLGAHVTICERNAHAGGQLVKQTHKFFGSAKQDAGRRGIFIAKDMVQQVQEDPNITLLTDAKVVSYYADRTVGILQKGSFLKYQADRIIVSTGAAEKFLTFPGNDLPGVYGAGAVQTLMNVAGVKPADRVLMVGAGNIGLIVSYQLRQAGVEVAGVVEAAPKIGGYLVHAAKLRRAGIPILTSHTILQAVGKEEVEGAWIAEVDEHFQPIDGTEQYISCDTICLAVGLNPLTEFLNLAECDIRYVRELSGYVPVTDRYLQTTTPGIYAAGDVTGIEEASSAMVEGRIAGLSAAGSLGYQREKAEELYEDAIREIDELRAGPTGARVRNGIAHMREKGGVIHVNLRRYASTY